MHWVHNGMTLLLFHVSKLSKIPRVFSFSLMNSTCWKDALKSHVASQLCSAMFDSQLRHIMFCRCIFVSDFREWEWTDLLCCSFSLAWSWKLQVIIKSVINVILYVACFTEFTKTWDECIWFLALPTVDAVDRLLTIVKVLCGYHSVMPAALHRFTDALHAREFVNFVWTKACDSLSTDTVYELHLYTMKLLAAVGVPLHSLLDKVCLHWNIVLSDCCSKMSLSFIYLWRPCFLTVLPGTWRSAARDDTYFMSLTLKTGNNSEI